MWLSAQGALPAGEAEPGRHTIRIMFVEAIAVAENFTRPLQIASRRFGSTAISRAAATFFAVNRHGWALTCKHVTDIIANAPKITERYDAYSAELTDAGGALNRDARRRLQRKHGFGSDTVVEVATRIAGLGKGAMELSVQPHPELDIALVKFPPFQEISTFPVFGADINGPEPGMLLCRLGFPYPEFTNFRYNTLTDRIEWDEGSDCVTPVFPLDGMVTRRVGSQVNNAHAFELSTPNIPGHSGGPVFDATAVVWGMQFATGHLDMGFDIRDDTGAPQPRAMFHVGLCVNSQSLITFMRQHKVEFRQV